MKFDKIIPMLTNVAPTIAAALGGPMAGMGVSALESLFGLTPGAAEKDPSALTAAVMGMSPDTAAKVRAADQDFAAKMKQLDIDVVSIAEKDRESARLMQTQTKDPTPRFIAGGVIVGFFGLVGMMAFRDIPVANHDVLLTLVGTLGACVTAVVSFYFGSSSNSQAKDATIRDLSR